MKETLRVVVSAWLLVVALIGPALGVGILLAALYGPEASVLALPVFVITFIALAASSGYQPGGEDQDHDEGE